MMYLLPRLEVSGKRPVCLFAVDLAGDFDRLHEDEVGASVRVGIGDGEGDRFVRLGGSEALTFLTEMSFRSGQRLGQVLFDEFAGETGPSGEETGVDSLDLGRWDGAAGSLMQILHDVLLALQFVHVVGLTVQGGWYLEVASAQDRNSVWESAKCCWLTVQGGWYLELASARDRNSVWGVGVGKMVVDDWSGMCQRPVLGSRRPVRMTWRPSRICT